MKTMTRKKIVLCAGVIALLAFTMPYFAHAAIWDIFSPTMILTSILRGIAYILSFIFGILFMIANFFVGIAMNFNDQILSTSNALVMVGWKISRDIANLGFVLLIIVIAFATILRIQSYGAKKLLPMLIGAAIIVNFSLTIGGVFINFASTLSQSFLDKMGGNYSEFTQSLAAAFGPQRLFLPPDNPPPPDPSEQGGAWTGFSAAILISIGNLTFIVVFSLIASMVMFLLAGMLMIRFIMLSFLLIIAPIVWLFWVFPALKHLFTKWWNTFFQWVFFQPAMLFFIYLSILSLSFLKDTAQPPSGNGVFGGLSTVITQGMQMVALCGFLIGGVIAAQKMGIAGAAGAMKLGKEAGKASAVWAGKKAYKQVTSPLREEGGRRFTERLQARGGMLGRVGNVLSNMGAIQGDNLVKEATKKQAHFSDRQLALRVATMKNEERVAALARLTKNKELDHVAGGATSYIRDPQTRDLFRRFGQGSAYTDMEKTVGVNTDILRLNTDWQRAVASNRPQEVVNNIREQLTDAMRTFERTYSMADFEKLQGNLFSAFDAERNNLGLSANDHQELGELRMSTVFEINPGAVARIRPKLRGDDLVNFQRNLNNFIDRFEDEIGLAEGLRGSNATVAQKLASIEQEHRGDPGLIARARSLYGTRNNLAGSLFGGGWAPTPHTPGGTHEEEEEEGH